MFSLNDVELALVNGGQIGAMGALGGYTGSRVFGGPEGFGGFGTFGGPQGAGIWNATSGPAAFSVWSGQGYTNNALGGAGLGGLGGGAGIGY